MVLSKGNEIKSNFIIIILNNFIILKYYFNYYLNS